MTTEAERLAKVFTYDKETGELTWSVAAGNGRIKEGTPAGSMSNNGYLRVMLGKKSHQVHKLAWLLSYGEFPSGTVHHIDGNKANNRLANLKLHTATPSKELKKARDMTDVELLDYLRVNLTYIDGCLYWKTSNSKRVAGKRVGTKTPRGYETVQILGKKFLTHRLVFLMHKGYLPVGIDHIDMNPSNNRIENLRECNQFQNQSNVKRRVTNKTGIKGIRHHSTGGYEASLTCNGVRWSKLSQSLEVAIEELNKKRAEMHKEFARYE